MMNPLLHTPPTHHIWILQGEFHYIHLSPHSSAAAHSRQTRFTLGYTGMCMFNAWFMLGCVLWVPSLKPGSPWWEEIKEARLNETFHMFIWWSPKLSMGQNVRCIIHRLGLMSYCICRFDEVINIWKCDSQDTVESSFKHQLCRII